MTYKELTDAMQEYGLKSPCEKTSEFELTRIKDFLVRHRRADGAALIHELQLENMRLKEKIQECVRYVSSEKFHKDEYVHVGDILLRLQ